MELNVEEQSIRKRVETPRAAAAAASSNAIPVDSHAERNPEVAKDKRAKASVEEVSTPIWPLKLSQYMLFSANVLVMQYISYFYTTTLALNVEQIGVANFVSKIASVSGQVCWPLLATWTGHIKGVTVLSTAAVASIVPLYLLPWVRGTFPSLCVVIAMHGFANAVSTLLDGLTMQVLSEKRKELVTYGDIRFFAVVGWISGALIAGQLVRLCGVDVIFPTFTFVSIANAVLMTIKLPSSTESAKAAGGGSKSSLRDFAAVFGSLEARAYFINLLVYGACAVLVEDFLSIYLIKDFSNTSPSIIGIKTAVAGLSELPTYKILSPWVLKKNIPLVHVLNAAQLVLSLRCFLYMFLPSPWMVLPIELLHGITFSLVWCMLVEYGKRLVAKESQAKMQMFISTLYFQAAYGLGGLLWPKFINRLGFRQTFGLNAAIVVAWVLLWRIVAGAVVSVGGKHYASSKEE